MLVLLACYVITTPHFPGAVKVELVNHKGLHSSLVAREARGPRMTRISEDGQAVFVLEDRYRRFLVYNPKPAPEEDLFLTRRSGKPSAYTTSQFAHLTLA